MFLFVSFYPSTPIFYFYPVKQNFRTLKIINYMAHSIAGIKKAMDYWWLLLLTGIALLSMGIWIFISPEDAYVSLSVLFGVCILFVGVFELLFALSAKRCFIPGAGQ